MTRSTTFKPFDAGEYRVLGVVGIGSFGVVYRALHLPSDELRALKCLSGRPGDTTESSFKSFVRDQIICRLNHPNIVTAFEPFDTTDPQSGMRTYYLPMELLEGRDLKRYLQQAVQIAPKEAIEIFLSCAGALSYAAANGVVHRDIKPSNIFLGADGSVKVLDFGVGKLTDTEKSSTADGGIPGTLDYLAPDFIVRHEENFRGDQLSDIFSFGQCLYEALTGNRPYQSFGDDERQRWIKYTMWALGDSSDNVDFSSRVFSDFPALISFLEKCLAKKRDHRFADFNKLHQALGVLRDELAHPGSSARSTTSCEQKIGEYRLLEKLDDSGSYARIYRAESKRLSRPVIIKLLRENMHDEQNLRRFRQEGEMLEKMLPCPYVVDFIEMIEAPDQRGASQYAIVMEYVEGASLGHYLREAEKRSTTPDPLWTLQVMSCVAEAIAFAHGTGFFHRDLKPDNIICTENGNAKLIDFGVAYAEEGSRFTNAGEFQGSWDYMPPELGYKKNAEGLPFAGDAISDIYSFGVCFYKALTGHLPFPPLEGRLQQIIIAFITRSPKMDIQDVSWDNRIFQETEELKNIIASCLNPKRDQREKNAAHICGRIKALLKSLRQPRLPGYLVEEFDENRLTAVEEGRGRRLVFHRVRNAEEEELAALLVRLANEKSGAILLPKVIKDEISGCSWFSIPISENFLDDIGFFDELREVPPPYSIEEEAQLQAIVDFIRFFIHFTENNLYLDKDSLTRFVSTSSQKLVYVPPPEPSKLIQLRQGTLSRSRQAAAETLLLALHPQGGRSIVSQVKKLNSDDLAQNSFKPPAVSGDSLCRRFPELARCLTILYHDPFSLSKVEERLHGLSRSLQKSKQYGKSIYPLVTPLRRVFGANRILNVDAAVASSTAAFHLSNIGLAGNYEFIEFIDRGGCGVVAKAVRLSDGAVVALKYPTRAKLRFSKEVRTLKKLSEIDSHTDRRGRAIVQYLDNFQEFIDANDEKVDFLVLEYLEGYSFSQIDSWAGKAAELKNLVELFITVAAGLSLCHENGVVHRDLKPSNLFVTSDGRAKILDFGIARDERGTVTGGNVPGTLEYMAPEFTDPKMDLEKCRSHPRADVFGLGVTMYKVLCGRLPYEQKPGKSSSSQTRWENYFERCNWMRLQSETDPRWFPCDKFNQWPKLIDFFARTLSPFPDKRPEKMSEVIDLLQEVHSSSESRPVQEPETMPAGNKIIMPDSSRGGENTNQTEFAPERPVRPPAGKPDKPKPAEQPRSRSAYTHGGVTANPQPAPVRSTGGSGQKTFDTGQSGKSGRISAGKEIKRRAVTGKEYLDRFVSKVVEKAYKPLKKVALVLIMLAVMMVGLYLFIIAGIPAFEGWIEGRVEQRIAIIEDPESSLRQVILAWTDLRKFPLRSWSPEPENIFNRLLRRMEEQPDSINKIGDIKKFIEFAGNSAEQLRLELQFQEAVGKSFNNWLDLIKHRQPSFEDNLKQHWELYQYSTAFDVDLQYRISEQLAELSHNGSGSPSLLFDNVKDEMSRYEWNPEPVVSDLKKMRASAVGTWPDEWQQYEEILPPSHPDKKRGAKYFAKAVDHIIARLEDLKPRCQNNILEYDTVAHRNHLRKVNILKQADADDLNDKIEGHVNVIYQILKACADDDLPNHYPELPDDILAFNAESFTDFFAGCKALSSLNQGIADIVRPHEDAVREELNEFVARPINEHASLGRLNEHIRNHQWSNLPRPEGLRKPLDALLALTSEEHNEQLRTWLAFYEYVFKRTGEVDGILEGALKAAADYRFNNAGYEARRIKAVVPDSVPAGDLVEFVRVMDSIKPENSYPEHSESLEEAIAIPSLENSKITEKLKDNIAILNGLGSDEHPWAAYASLYSALRQKLLIEAGTVYTLFVKASDYENNDDRQDLISQIEQIGRSKQLFEDLSDTEDYEEASRNWRKVVSDLITTSLESNDRKDRLNAAETRLDEISIIRAYLLPENKYRELLHKLDEEYNRPVRVTYSWPPPFPDYKQGVVVYYEDPENNELIQLPTELVPGAYSLRINREGEFWFSQEVEIERGGVKMDVELIPAIPPEDVRRKIVNAVKEFEDAIVQSLYQLHTNDLEETLAMLNRARREVNNVSVAISPAFESLFEEYPRSWIEQSLCVGGMSVNSQARVSWLELWWKVGNGDVDLQDLEKEVAALAQERESIEKNCNHNMMVLSAYWALSTLRKDQNGTAPMKGKLREYPPARRLWVHHRFTAHRMESSIGLRRDWKRFLESIKSDENWNWLFKDGLDGRMIARLEELKQ